MVIGRWGGGVNCSEFIVVLPVCCKPGSPSYSPIILFLALFCLNIKRDKYVCLHLYAIPLCVSPPQDDVTI